MTDAAGEVEAKRRCVRCGTDGSVGLGSCRHAFMVGRGYGHAFDDKDSERKQCSLCGEIFSARGVGKHERVCWQRRGRFLARHIEHANEVHRYQVTIVCVVLGLVGFYLVVVDSESLLGYGLLFGAVFVLPPWHMLWTDDDRWAERFDPPPFLWRDEPVK